MMPYIFVGSVCGVCVCVPYVQPNHAKAQLWFTVGYPFKSSQLVKYPYIICINMYYIYMCVCYIICICVIHTIYYMYIHMYTYIHIFS